MVPAMENLARQLIGMPRQNIRCTCSTTPGNPMTEANVTTGWKRAMIKAPEEGMTTKRFTFHDRRADYMTQHKESYGSLPELHANRPRRPWP
jgi:hypothetical protein